VKPANRLHLIEGDLAELREAMLAWELSNADIVLNFAGRIKQNIDALALELRNELDLCMSIRPDKKTPSEEGASLEGR